MKSLPLKIVLSLLLTTLAPIPARADEGLVRLAPMKASAEVLAKQRFYGRAWSELTRGTYLAAGASESGPVGESLRAANELADTIQSALSAPRGADDVWTSGEDKSAAAFTILDQFLDGVQKLAAAIGHSPRPDVRDAAVAESVDGAIGALVDTSAALDHSRPHLRLQILGFAGAWAPRAIAGGHAEQGCARRVAAFLVSGEREVVASPELGGKLREREEQARDLADAVRRATDEGACDARYRGTLPATATESRAFARPDPRAVASAGAREESGEPRDEMTYDQMRSAVETMRRVRAEMQHARDERGRGDLNDRAPRAAAPTPRAAARSSAPAARSSTATSAPIARGNASGLWSLPADPKTIDMN